MLQVHEFKTIEECNKYLKENRVVISYDIIPISRMFENPTSKLIVSCISYIVIVRT